MEDHKIRFSPGSESDTNHKDSDHRTTRTAIDQEAMAKTLSSAKQFQLMPPLTDFETPLWPGKSRKAQETNVKSPIAPRGIENLGSDRAVSNECRRASDGAVNSIQDRKSSRLDPALHSTIGWSQWEVHSTREPCEAVSPRLVEPSSHGLLSDTSSWKRPVIEENQEHHLIVPCSLAAVPESPSLEGHLERTTAKETNHDEQTWLKNAPSSPGFVPDTRSWERSWEEEATESPRRQVSLSLSNKSTSKYTLAESASPLSDCKGPTSSSAAALSSCETDRVDEARVEMTQLQAGRYGDSALISGLQDSLRTFRQEILSRNFQPKGSLLQPTLTTPHAMGNVASLASPFEAAPPRQPASKSPRKRPSRSGAGQERSFDEVVLSRVRDRSLELQAKVCSPSSEAGYPRLEYQASESGHF